MVSRNGNFEINVNSFLVSYAEIQAARTQSSLYYQEDRL